MVTCATRRTGAAALNPAVKSLNYLNNVMARIEANLAGADEALMLNEAGNVAECTADNVFIIKRGQIFTPPIAAGALARDHAVGRFRYRGGARPQDHRDGHHAARCLCGGRMFSHRHGRRSDSGDQSGRAHDRNGKPGSITTRMIARFRELTRETGTPIFA